MQKIQKFIKKHAIPIICFIIGIFITVAATFYATETKYSSSNVTYDNTSSELSSTNIQAAIDELKGKIDRRGFKLGDYFTMVPDSSSYTIKSSTTGYDTDQTINPSELKLWRVIDIHSDGSVDAVSEYVSSTAVYFRGATGYANFVGGLQTIATQYAKVGYTIDTRMMGYGGQTATIQPKSSTCTGTCQTTTTYAFDGSKDTAPSTTETPSPYTGVGQEYNGGVLGDTLYLKDIQLVGNVYKTDTTKYGNYGLKAYKVNATTTNGNYWLASRRFNYYSAAFFYWYGRFVDSGSLDSDSLRGFYSRWYDNFRSYSVRPIITLKSGIQIAGGSGTITSPYTITT